MRRYHRYEDMEIFASQATGSSRAQDHVVLTDRLRKECSSLWSDNRNTITNSRVPNPKHHLSKESLWMDGLYDPTWVSADMLTLHKTKERCAINVMHTAQEDLKKKTIIIHSNIGGGWKMLSIEEALASLEKGTMPSVDDFLCILHKCRKKRNLAYSRRLHAIMRKSGLEGHRSFGNHLVAMLVEVGSMCNAQQVFDRLTYRNECSWNAIITGYVECGESQHALILYQHMQEDDSVHPSGYTFVALLRACANLKDLERGREIHAEIARKGSLEKDIFVGSTLVSMYAKCGSLAKAHKVLYKLPDRSVVSWNALIAGYAEYGHGEEALICYEEMQREGVSPNAITFVCSLKSCASIGAMDKGRELHAEIARKGLETNLLVGSTLVDMYAKCGSLAKAKEVFDKLPIQDVVSWTALIAGYTEHGYGEEALNSFKHMQHAGVSPNSATFVCSFKACGSIGALDEGRELHAEIAKKGLERDLVVGSTLIDMYAKCGLLAEAQEIFDRLPVRDVVSWTALIAGYAEHGRGKDALNCFERMQHEGISPNAATFVCSLKACGSIGAIDKGGELHAKITRSGLERDHLVSSTLVDMYAKCGSVAKAQEMFEKLSVRDVVSWTSLIAGYAEHGHGEDALNCFEQMQHEGVSPNAATFVCSLKACGSIGSTDKGQALHAEIVTKGLEKDLLIGSTLVDMYAKCGSLSKAQEVFDKLPLRNVVAWNVLIAGYAQLGDSKNIFNIFDRMIGECIKPNLVTFISVLNACSHAGLVEKGQMYFEAMNKDYGILPTFEHHTCMIDLLGRAGQLDKAVAMVKKMPFHPDLLMVWHTVLGACQKWGNVEIGRQAFEHVVRLDEKDAAAYVCMSNIYADADMQEETNDVEATIYADATLYKHCRR